MLIIQSLLAIIHGVLAVAMVALILLQQGKGADVGASFGSGSSSTVFGSTGSGNFLTRLTSLLAVFFVVNCLALVWISKQQVNRGSLLDEVAIEAPEDEEHTHAEGEEHTHTATVEAASDSDNPVLPVELVTDEASGEADDTPPSPISEDSDNATEAGAESPDPGIEWNEVSDDTEQSDKLQPEP